MKNNIKKDKKKSNQRNPNIYINLSFSILNKGLIRPSIIIFIIKIYSISINRRYIQCLIVIYAILIYLDLSYIYIVVAVRIAD